MPRAPASAPQPAHGADVPMQIAPDLLLQRDTCSAPQPAQYVDRSDAQPIGYGELCGFLFYNIGWQADSKQPHHNKENLADEICEMVIAKGCDGIGIWAGSGCFQQRVHIYRCSERWQRGQLGGKRVRR